MQSTWSQLTASSSDPGNNHQIFQSRVGVHVAFYARVSFRTSSLPLRWALLSSVHKCNMIKLWPWRQVLLMTQHACTHALLTSVRLIRHLPPHLNQSHVQRNRHTVLCIPYGAYPRHRGQKSAKNLALWPFCTEVQPNNFCVYFLCASPRTILDHTNLSVCSWPMPITKIAGESPIKQFSLTCVAWLMNSLTIP